MSHRNIWVAIITLGLIAITTNFAAAANKANTKTISDPFDETPYLTMYQLLPKIYKMTPAQKQKFDSLLKELTLEYHDYLAGKAELVDQVRNESIEMQIAQQEGKKPDIAQQRALQKKRSAIIMGSPLGIKNVTAKAETFLTPEQIAVAHGQKKKPTSQPTTSQPATSQPTTKPCTPATTTRPCTTQPATCPASSKSTSCKTTHPAGCKPCPPEKCCRTNPKISCCKTAPATQPACRSSQRPSCTTTPKHAK